MKALAYVVKMFPRFSETFILNELLELERRGHQLTVYSLKRPREGPVHPAVRRLEARIVYLPERPVHWLSHGVRSALPHLRADAERGFPLLGYVASRGTHQAWKRYFQAAALARDLASRPVDHLHAHFASAPSRVAMFASQLTGTPFSFTAHAKDIYQDGTDLDLLRDKMRAARFVVTVSEFNRAYLLGLYGFGGDDSLRRLYNGVDLRGFRPAGWPMDAREPVVLAVGRCVEKKGFDDLIVAWSAVLARVPAARLVIVGDGPEQARLRALAERHGVAGAVRWEGAQAQERVRALLGEAAVFCLPCRVAADGNRDGLPTALLEALASGVPCVTTKVTGNPEILTDGVEGRLVPPGNPAALAEALGDLLADRGMLARMSLAARRRAEERFDLAANVGRLSDWFAEVT
jgi:colanic acid/amylovoran biosynthesis glycosyltransferase